MNLATIRKGRNISQAELSKKSGYTQATISLWERGKRMPSYQSILILADILDVSVDELLGTAPSTIEYSEDELKLLDLLKEASANQLKQITDYAKFLLQQPSESTKKGAGDGRN